MQLNIIIKNNDSSNQSLTAIQVNLIYLKEKFLLCTTQWRFQDITKSGATPLEASLNSCRERLREGKIDPPLLSMLQFYKKFRHTFYEWKFSKSNSGAAYRYFFSRGDFSLEGDGTLPQNNYKPPQEL